jgi:hypothetical protein
MLRTGIGLTHSPPSLCTPTSSLFPILQAHCRHRPHPPRRHPRPFRRGCVGGVDGAVRQGPASRGGLSAHAPLGDAPSSHTGWQGRAYARIRVQPVVQRHSAQYASRHDPRVPWSRRGDRERAADSCDCFVQLAGGADSSIVAVSELESLPVRRHGRGRVLPYPGCASEPLCEGECGQDGDEDCNQGQHKQPGV